MPTRRRRVVSLYPGYGQRETAAWTIIAVGQGNKKEDGTRIALDVKEGDMVLFSKYSGNEIKLDNQEYLIMHETDLLGIVEK